MAWGVKYRCIHKAHTGDSTGVTTEWHIELLKEGHTGAVTEVKGAGSIGGLSYPRVDITKLFSQPIQKGIAEFELLISPEVAYNGQTIIDEIFAGDETTFLMRIRSKVGAGSLQTLFTGFVMNDLNETTDGEKDYTSKIFAKDLTRAAGITWPITDDRITVLQTIADLLDELGLGLDIYTYTSFITSETTDTNDYLAQIYNDRFNLQQYANTGNEEPEAITVEKALDWVLRSHKLFIRQIDGAWRIFHLSAFNDPANVMEWRYDNTGTAVSSATKDFTVNVDRVSKFILPGGTRAKTKAYKSVEVNFNHRTKTSGLIIPNRIEITNTDYSKTQSVFISTGQQIIKVGAGSIGVECDTNVGPVTVEVEVSINGTIYNKTAVLSLVGELDHMPGYYRWAGTLSHQFTPDAADDGTLIVSFKKAAAPGGVDFLGTIYDGVFYEVINDVTAGNSTYIKYQLTQSGNWSNNLELDKTYFGDGPIDNSRAALRYGTFDADTTAGIWQRRGTTTGYRNFHENTLKEVMDIHRGIRDNFQGDLWGYYSALSVIQKDGKNLFFFGGELTIGTNSWNTQLTEINLETAVDDTFSSILKYSDPNTSDATPGETQSSSTGGGLTEDIADDIYFRQDNNLSEGTTATMRTNLGLGESDEPTFAGASLNPDTAKAPFTLNVNAQGQLVTGLNADQLDGYHYNELPYDDFQQWTLTLNGAAPTVLGSLGTLNFADSADVVVSKNGSGDVQFTLASPVTDTNDYLIQTGTGFNDTTEIFSYAVKNQTTVTVDISGIYSKTGHSHSNATTGSAGFMSAADKSKLNGIEAGADDYNNWQVTTDTAGAITVGSESLLTIAGGTDIGVTHSGSTITIDWQGSTTDTNDYLIQTGTGFNTSTEIFTYAVQNQTSVTIDISGVYSKTSHTHANATTGSAGFMSAADKSKLNGIEAGADDYNNWQVTTDTAGAITVSSETLLTISGGTDINVTHSGSAITVDFVGSTSGGVVDALKDDSGTTVSQATIGIIGGTSISTSVVPQSIQIDYTGSSDKKLKTAWQHIITGSLHDRFMKLQAGSYKWKNKRYNRTKYNPDGRSMGMIAQDFIEQFPELATESHNLFGIDYPMFAGSVLTSELQYAHNRIDETKSEIDKLKSQNATLEKKIRALEKAA